MFFTTIRKMWLSMVLPKTRGTSGANVHCLENVTTSQVCVIHSYFWPQWVWLVRDAWDAWRMHTIYSVIVTARYATVILLYHNSIWSWCKHPQIKADSQYFKAIVNFPFQNQCAAVHKPPQQKICHCPNTFWLHCIYGRIVSSSSGRVVYCL